MMAERRYTDEQIEDAMRFLRGPFGRWLHTYPTSVQQNQRDIYDFCCELERLGRVKRVVNAPDRVVFEAIGKAIL